MYPFDARFGGVARTGESCVPFSVFGHSLNVMQSADGTGLSWYNFVFPGVFPNGIAEKHRRSICSGNDGEPIGADMRSSS